jgi:hypothetical protein
MFTLNPAKAEAEASLRLARFRNSSEMTLKGRRSFRFSQIHSPLYLVTAPHRLMAFRHRKIEMGCPWFNAS